MSAQLSKHMGVPLPSGPLKKYTLNFSWLGHSDGGQTHHINNFGKHRFCNWLWLVLKGWFLQNFVSLELKFTPFFKKTKDIIIEVLHW